MRRNAPTIAGTALALTTSVPVWARSSKPQMVIVTARSCDTPTGHPRCQLLPRAVAVTVRECHLNAGAGATTRATLRDRDGETDMDADGVVAIEADACAGVTATPDALGVPAVCGALPEWQAASADDTASTDTARRRLRTPP